RSPRGAARLSSEAVVEDGPRAADLDRGEEVEGAVRADYVAARRELPAAAGRHVHAEALTRMQASAKRVERRGLEADPVARGVTPLRGRQLRVARDAVLHVGQHLRGRDPGGRGERGAEDGGGDDPQPDRRTPRSTRMALKPSLHVIFFPSA